MHLAGLVNKNINTNPELIPKVSAKVKACNELAIPPPLVVFYGGEVKIYGE
jgi:hypothetical protein